jgi:hypothetical protein
MQDFGKDLLSRPTVANANFVVGVDNAQVDLVSYHGHGRHHVPANTGGSGDHGHGHGHGHAQKPAVAADAGGHHGKPGKDDGGAAPAESNVIGPAKRLPTQSGFLHAMGTYWQQITSAKRQHRYLTSYPPVYAGMDEPRVAPSTVPPAAPETFRSTGHQPSLNDLFNASKDLNRIVSHDKTRADFKTLEVSEPEFKKRYAAETLVIGKSYGLDSNHMANLVKRIYAFEGGGWGTYYTLSSMPQGLMDDSHKQERLNFHPSSSAMGYNQLLIKNTTNGIIDHGGAIADRLEALAAQEPARAKELHEKAELVHGIQDILTHKAKLPPHHKGDKNRPYVVPRSKLETAIQGLNLDGDIGPIIQSQELNSLLKYSAANKFGDYLALKTAQQTTHAREYDALPAEKKAEAIDQLFALIKPSEIHPTNPALDAPFYATKEALHQKVLRLGPIGQDHSLERENLPDMEFRMMNSQVLTIRRYGGAGGPLSPEARALLDRVTSDYFGGFSADKLQAAAIEMANLSGMGTAQSMLQPDHGNLPTSNFFAKDGYQSNPVTSRRSADELLLQIYRIMRGPNGDSTKPGNSQFDQAFNSLKKP